MALVLGVKLSTIYKFPENIYHCMLKTPRLSD
jgi:hypothetical protein